jgi:hypothetical protein
MTSDLVGADSSRRGTPFGRTAETGEGNRAEIPRRARRGAPGAEYTGWRHSPVLVRLLRACRAG